jgi:uncharacterized protein GlcG (DUF336 family)
MGVRIFARFVAPPAGAGRAFLVLAAGLVWAGQPASLAQEPHGRDSLVSPARHSSALKDTARIFSESAIAAAQRELERVERETGVATVIETVNTLDDKPVNEVASRLARQSGIQGIFALIARKEKSIDVLVSRKYQTALPRDRRNRIRDAFIEAFRRQDFDGGLQRGVAAIAQVLAAAAKAGELPKSSTAEQALLFDGGQGSKTTGDAGGLIVRNQVRLTLAGARAMIGAAEATAQSMSLKVNIAVVDDGGHLLAFARMDGARPASGYTAITKATTAATLRLPTGPFPPGTTNPDPLLNLSLQNAALASGGKITTLFGGVPVVVEGQVIGGVGVGGGTGEQDAQVARAGLQALLDRLAAAGEPKKPALAEKPDQPE